MIRRLLWMMLVPLAVLSCGKGDEPSPQDGGTPGVPGNVVLRGATENTLTFQWNPVEGADKYAWKLRADRESTREGTVAARNVTIPSLSSGTTYHFSVAALSGEKASAYSIEIEGVTEGTSSPGEPVGVVMCIDEPLLVTFQFKPVLGTSGTIRLYTSAGQEVDRIDLKDIATVDIREDGQMVPKAQMTKETAFNTFMDAIPSGKRWRIVPYTPLRVKGNSLEIRFHSGILEFGKSYYVTMDEGVVGGFPGMAPGDVELTVKPKPASETTLSVAPDCSGDFCTIQGALCYASTLSGPVTVNVAPGTYNELLFLREKADVRLTGTSRDGCILSAANAEVYANGTGGSLSSRPSVGAAVATVGGRSLCLFENCDNLVIENLTLHNTFGAQGQAEVIYFNSGSNAHRLILENCALHSLQDTFLCKGEVWVHNSLIAGNVDFIWGYPRACLFEDCEIRCEAYSKGFILQARVPSASDKGFVFLNCRLTAGEGAKDGSMYLARSGGSTDYYDNVTFVNCQMSSVIAAEGWYSSPAPNPSVPTASTGWKEYGTTGVSTTGRNKYGKTLSAEEAAPYMSKASVLGW